jgi:hypothetical protein
LLIDVGLLGGRNRRTGKSGAGHWMSQHGVASSVQRSALQVQGSAYRDQRTADSDFFQPLATMANDPEHSPINLHPSSKKAVGPWYCRGFEPMEDLPATPTRDALFGSGGQRL